MRSSYKTTVKSPLKSGEVFTVPFLQSLWHFYGPLMKILRVTHCQGWRGRKSYRKQGRENRRWHLHPSSARDKTTAASARLVCASGSTGRGNTVAENMLSSFKRCQQVASRICVHSATGRLSSFQLLSSLPARCWGRAEAEQIDTCGKLITEHETLWTNFRYLLPIF